MTDDVHTFPADQQGDYAADFDFSLMSAAQWRKYYRIGQPSWRHPVARLRWMAANADLWSKLNGQGVWR